jgi:hypothetical protein
MKVTTDLITLIKDNEKANLSYFITFSIFTFAQEVSKERVKTVISTLASDEMKGREIWTPENENAANYIASLFKENKLEYCTGNSYLILLNIKVKRLTTYVV